MHLVKTLWIRMDVALCLLALLSLQSAHSKPTENLSNIGLDDQRQQTVVVSPRITIATDHSTQTQTPNQFTSHNDPTRAIHYHFDQEMDPYMQLHKFTHTSRAHKPTQDSADSGNNVTCNDGTPAGYYKRLNNHSKSWIIYLQGGGYCGSEETCQLRWRRSAHLMSSSFWPKSMSVEGILSSEPKDNPYLWNANHIYVPYCSSDSWTGLQEARPDQSSFAFMGSKIIEKVLDSLFDDLPRDSSLFEARFILLAGDSAGATGVILNLDKVNRYVQERFSETLRGSTRDCPFPENPNLCNEQKPQVPIIRGLADSGWFLDNEPYDIYQQPMNAAADVNSPPVAFSSQTSSTPVEPDCDRQRCSPLQSIKQAMLHWNGQVPASCANKQTNEPWRCYFAYRAYATLRTPLFVVQWLYDEAQLMVDNIVRPGTISQWNYVNKLVNEMRVSLENVTALFAPSCFSHSLIIKQSWNQININGFKLPHILNSWEEETLASQPSYSTLLKDQQAPEQPETTHTYQISLSSDHVTQPPHTANREQSYSDRLVALQHQNHQPEVHTSGYQFEMRSAVQRQSVSTGNGQAPSAGQGRARSRKKKRNNNQNLGSTNRINSSNSNRLSRSTIVEEAAMVSNNNVPDVFHLPSAANRQHDGDAEKFRLIDSCGWPQCNRDCPNLDLDFGLRSILSPY